MERCIAEGCTQPADWNDRWQAFVCSGHAVPIDQHGGLDGVLVCADWECVICHCTVCSGGRFADALSRELGRLAASFRAQGSHLRVVA